MLRNWLATLLYPVRLVIARLMRLAFQALYYPLAPFYDQISHTAFVGQWSKWQKAVLPRIVGKRVLELGCGTGSLYLEMRKWGMRPVGLDASPFMLRQARKKFEAAGVKGELVLGKSQFLPFPDETFESVVSIFPSEYILDSRTLHEIWRVLYPGGRLIIVDTAQLKPFNRRAAFLYFIYTRILGYGGRPGNNEVYARFDLLLREVGLLRRDEMYQDEQGEAHIITAIKVW
jgi:ubiquinone/menaquinone biosynthesis C-methylase UbiE